MDATVAWTTTLAGPWGPIHLAATRVGVVAVAWLTTAEAFELGLAARLHGSVEPVGSRVPASVETHLAAGVRSIVAVLDGTGGQSPSLDLADRPAWDRTVLAEVGRIRSGSTASYGEVARRIGRTGAARAVGGAVGRNPIALLVPCHRVIASDGTLGGYGGDGWGDQVERLAIKRDLLLREGVTMPPSRG